MTTTNRAKKFVSEHPVLTAFCAGAAAGVAAMIVRDIPKTLLEVTPQQVRLLQDNGGAMLFESKKLGDLYLSVAPLK